MRCLSICNADSYFIDSLAKDLRSQGMDPKFYDDVIHIEANINDKAGHAYIFGYGCIVFWNMNTDNVESLLNITKLHASSPLPDNDIVTDECHYHYGEETQIIEENDEVILEPDDALIMLSLSYGMSQSVKLATFEDLINKIIQKTKHLPEELATKGSTSLSRRKLSKYTGALFAQRHSINLHNDLLDTPEFFWRRPRYESYYHMASVYLDITTRTQILNQRLSVLHDLYGILSDELKHLHSSRLELIIIYLIMFEVVLVILKDILKLI